MEKYCIVLEDSNNKTTYVSNISPLLWTNEKDKAKIFFSKSEAMNDIAPYHNSLVNIIDSEVGREIKIVQIE